MKAHSYVQENGQPVQILRSTGDVAAALQAAPHTINNARHDLVRCAGTLDLVSARHVQTVLDTIRCAAVCNHSSLV